MKKYLIFLIPSSISILTFIIIIQPGYFNMIPYFIHQKILGNSVEEYLFIYIFDFVICIILWFIIYSIIKKIFYN